MSSSIFSFDLIRAFARLPAARHRRHLALVAGLLATYLACLHVLARVFGAVRPETTRTLAVQALSPATEAIFLGNSVVEAAIDSTLYPRPVMALPMANGNWEVDELILNRHAPGLPGLRQVVLQLDTTCLAWDRLGITLDFGAFHELGIPLQEIPRPAWWRWRQRVVEHPWVYPLLFGERLTPRQLLWEPRYGSVSARPEPGYIPLRGVLTEADRAAYFARPVAMEPRQPEVLERNQAALFRMIDLLRARGVEPVLLRYPSRGGYAFFRAPEWDDALAAVGRNLAARPGGSPRVIDLADDPSFATADFRDTVHLNRAGAAKLARRLVELGIPARR
jgi:hypothetical protein